METLMHTCCAPCSVSCIRQLRGEGIEPVSFWYNPNIHPYQEYKARRDTLMAYAPAIGMKLIVREDYGLRDFCRAVCGDIDHRCGHCYHIRLWETARYAAEHGYGSFTSTLFVSPYQNHELLRRRRRPKPTAWNSCTGISDPGSGQASRRPGSVAFTCRNTAGACSARRTATASSSTGT